MWGGEEEIQCTVDLVWEYFSRRLPCLVRRAIPDYDDYDKKERMFQGCGTIQPGEHQQHNLHLTTFYSYLPHQPIADSCSCLGLSRASVQSG